MKLTYKWIKFKFYGKNKEHCECRNKEGELLGTVEYENGWRQFVFDMNYLGYAGTMFNFRCLEDIADFLKQLNKTKGCYKEKQ